MKTFKGDEDIIPAWIILILGAIAVIALFLIIANKYFSLV